MAKGQISRHIEQRVRADLSRYDVVVWYDSGGWFTQLVDHLDLPPRTLTFKFRDSYYRLRDEVDEAYARLARGNAPGSLAILVYVPRQPLDRRLDVLLPYARTGCVINETLASFAREVLRGRLAEPHLEELLSNPNLTLEELDDIAEGEGAGDAVGGILSTVFGPIGTHEVAARYLTDPSIDSVLAQKQALYTLEKMAAQSFEMPQAIGKAADLRTRLARHILLTDFRLHLPPEVAIPTLDAIPLPDEKAAALCAQTADYMRHHISMRQAYCTLARQVEAEYGLRDPQPPAGQLVSCDTFPFIDRLCMDEVSRLVEKGSFDEAADIALTRRQAFWAQADEKLGVEWQVVSTAVRLTKASTAILKQTDKEFQTPEEAVRRYADPEDGWCRIDLYQRLLERDLMALEEDFAHDSILQAARRAYRQVASRLATGFSDSLSQHGLVFGDVPHQTDTFHKYVEPRLGQECVAYMLIDALRFEMAVDLAEQLERAGRVEGLELLPSVASAPTITPVGMASLMPRAEQGIRLEADENDKLVVKVGDAVLRNPMDRRNYLDAYTGRTTLDLTFQDLFVSKRYQKVENLAAEIADKQIVLVRSTSIDDQGELDNPESAWRTMTEVLTDVRKAVYRLAAAGVRRFVIAADHGYLLGDELSDPMKIDPPGGRPMLLRRRCWVGRGGSESPAFMRLRAANLGLAGDLEFAFPYGLGVFKAKGGAGTYYHGGLSLQEVVVPVLTFQAVSPEGEPPGDRFRIWYEQSQITNRLFSVILSYQHGTVSPPTRRVRCEILVEGQQVGTAATAQYGYDTGAQEVELASGRDNVVTLFLKARQVRGQADIQVRDADTGAVLARLGPVPFEFTS